MKFRCRTWCGRAQDYPLLEDVRMNGVLSGVAGLTSVLLALSLAGTAEAQVEVTGNVAIASDYAFRGISQTLEKPAIQGGLDLGLPSSLYAGVWGSSVNFGEDLLAGPRAQMELDFYGGIAPSISGFDVDLGAIYYAYPGAAGGRDYNFFEAYAGVGRGFGVVSTGLDVAYSPDFFGGSGAGLWTGASASAEVPGLPVALEATFGRQAIDDNATWGTPNYNAWSLGAGTDVLGATIGATVAGTSLRSAECFGGSDLCGTRVIFSIARGL
jgi:uncharacterized protein (TIGR02001 family)